MGRHGGHCASRCYRQRHLADGRGRRVPNLVTCPASSETPIPRPGLPTRPAGGSVRRSTLPAGLMPRCSGSCSSLLFRGALNLLSPSTATALNGFFRTCVSRPPSFQWRMRTKPAVSTFPRPSTETCGAERGHAARSYGPHGRASGKVRQCKQGHQGAGPPCSHFLSRESGCP